MIRFVFSSVIVLSVAPVTLAQAVPTAMDATSVAVDAMIDAVTVYRGRASVTRTATLTLEPGLYDVQFTALPESIQPDTIQARVSGPMKVLGVDYEEKAVATAPSQQIAELDVQIRQVQRSLKEIKDQGELIEAQERFIAAVSVRSTRDATEKGGTKDLDLEVVGQQLAFVTEQRAKLSVASRELDARQRELDKQLRILQSQRSAMAGRSTVNRTAIVSVVVTAASQTTIDLVYLVSNATWAPTYNIRAAADGSSVTVEYDALLSQRSGEDWDEVKLTLSTAQPTLAANPPTLTPWYVDIQRLGTVGRRGFGGGLDRMMAPEAAEIPMEKYAAATPPAPEALEQLAADAAVGGTGPSVTFHLPRLVTVKTNAQKQQRTRIATVDTDPEFVHVASPLLTQAVYIRGELTNASSYQLLPGKASIFVGQDYVGPTHLGSVSPNGEFELYFGIDQSIKATRQLVAKQTSRKGVFRGGRETSYDYRLEIDNGAGKPITIELWDRYPISRTDQVKIELVDVSRPLATDAEYVEEHKPQGLLKWVLNVPAAASGKSAFVVTYGVQINRPKDLAITPLPE
ncbi:MAG: mucoidy inhibitor MuiA family protein [Planctomycetota bacterium]|nr:mucoidy inhibitor MuiA family protein [Planctomycetota bacterium]